MAIVDKMEIAERCIDDVLMSARHLLDAQVVAIRDTRQTIDSMREITRLDEESEEEPGPWGLVAGS